MPFRASTVESPTTKGFSSMSALPSSVVFLLVRSAPAIVDLAHRRGGRATDAIRVDLETEGLALLRMRESTGRRATLFTVPTEHTASERAVLLFIDRWITQQEDPPAMYTDVFADETATVAMRMAPAATPLSPTPATIGHVQRDVSPCDYRGSRGHRSQDGHGGAATMSTPISNNTTAAQSTDPTRENSVRPPWRRSKISGRTGRPVRPRPLASPGGRSRYQRRSLGRWAWRRLGSRRTRRRQTLG